MEVIIRPTEEAAAKLTAKIIADAINDKPEFKLGLATGATMEAVYAELSALNKANKVDFSQVRTWNLDEYVGLAPEHDQSYRYYMNKNLFNNVNIDKRNTHLPDGLAINEELEAAVYDESIDEAGGIDLWLVGIGKSGHIGFNDPGTSLASRTHVAYLTNTTYEQNKIYFNPPESMPRRAFTAGVGTVLDAKKVVQLITGERKADIAAAAIEGPITSMISSTALQMHPDTVVILDEAAAAKLKLRDFYNEVFMNDPKWEAYR
ncbi:MAG: glucosamine-6-phosphate deaminase [Victivallaceae bacterium]|nr:glucosamine-6-phosphate deaminase [Victivallaceae bacterium]